MTMCRTLGIVAGLVGLALGGAWARADEPPAAKRVAEIELTELLDAVAARTGVLFGWNSGDKLLRERKVRLTRDVLASGELDLQMLRSLLTANELVLVPQGPKGKEVHWVMDARQQGAILRVKAEPIELSEATLPRYEQADGVFVTTQIPVAGSINVRELRTALSRIVTQQNIGSVTELTDPNALVVTDFAPNVCAIWRLVRQMEAAAAGPQGRTSQLVTLQHASARELASALAGSLAPSPVPAAPVQPQPQAQGAAGGLRIQGLPRTNQLLIHGTPAEVQPVLKLVAQLDVPVHAEPSPEVHVVRLQHASAADLASLLNSLSEDPSGPGQPWLGDAARPYVLLDARTNSLVISATPRAMERVRALIAQLDVPGAAPK